MAHKPVLIPPPTDGASARFRVAAVTLIGYLVKDERNLRLLKLWAEHTGLLKLGFEVARYRLDLDDATSPPHDWLGEEIERRLSDDTFMASWTEALHEAVKATFGIDRHWVTGELIGSYLQFLSWLITGAGYTVHLPVPIEALDHISRGLESREEFARRLRAQIAAQERTAAAERAAKRRPRGGGVHLETWVRWWYEHRVKQPPTSIAALADAHAGPNGDPENARRLIQRRLQQVEEIFQSRP